MRTNSMLLAGVVTLAACADLDAPSTNGTLLVSTSTGGDDPDQDGYLLNVDGFNALSLHPTGTARVDLPTGHHTLRLLGVAEHCSATPESPLEVDVSSQDTTSVAFAIGCLATGVRITTTTTGPDFDPNGYRVEVDGADQGTLPWNSTTLIRLEPGIRTIVLTGLAPNCTVEGPNSRTATVVGAEIAPVEFVVVCTATSGVIGVRVAASGIDVEGDYVASVDSARFFFARPSGPAYLTAVPPGDHVVSLVAPPNCSLETDPQSVSVTAGGLIRDTAEVTFSVACVPRVSGRLRITAPTTGPIPTAPYSVWICRVTYDCIFYGTWTFFSALEPNDTLVANPEPARYQLRLLDVPSGCRVRPSILSPEFTITENATVDIEFRVRC